MPTLRPMFLVLAAALTASATPRAGAWDAVGHRAITWLALDGLAPDAPAWLRADAAKNHMTGWQAAEPDRWRNNRGIHMRHENGPDHYMDAEDLENYGLTLETLPRLRYQFVAAMAVARHVHPDRVQPANPKLDPAGEQEWPGFVLHAIMEHHAKLTSSFKTLRTLEKINDPARAPQLEMARANVMFHLGVLSHFVGDTAQPLHTTRHHHGWIGDNPEGYTTDRGIHAYIDGGVIGHHKITYHTLVPGRIAPPAWPAEADVWDQVVAHFKRSHDKVERVYQLEKSGAFKQAEGRAFIEERLHDAAATLAALCNHAWAASEPTQKDVDDLIRYDGFDAAQVPGAPKREGSAERQP